MPMSASAIASRPSERLRTDRAADLAQRLADRACDAEDEAARRPCAARSASRRRGAAGRRWRPGRARPRRTNRACADRRGRGCAHARSGRWRRESLPGRGARSEARDPQRAIEVQRRMRLADHLAVLHRPALLCAGRAPPCRLSSPLPPGRLLRAGRRRWPLRHRPRCREGSLSARRRRWHRRRCRCRHQPQPPRGPRAAPPRRSSAHRRRSTSAALAREVDCGAPGGPGAGGGSGR